MISNGVKFLVGKKDILANTAKWIVCQSPYVPENLIIILQKIREKLLATDEFKKAEKDNLGYIEMEFRELEKWLDAMFREIPEYMDLNLSKAERDKGVKVEDPNRGHGASSIYWTTKDEYEFVDLDALIRNICMSLEQDK